MLALRDAGRKMIFWGALILAVWAGYELYIRIDAMAKPLAMFFKMWAGEKVPFARAVTYVDFSILEIPLYLALCAALGILSLALRKKPWLWGMLVLLSPAFAVYSVGVKAVLMPSVWDLIKLLPLLLLLLGSLLSLAAHALIRRSRKARPLPEGTQKQPVAYDPFGMGRGGWARQDRQRKE